MFIVILKLIISSFIQVAQEAIPETISRNQLIQVSGKFFFAFTIGFFELIRSKLKQKK